ncbi:hypothetical protein MP228_009091 [Amoeboaphelidium protococcarum]|nr:hypothetical protein MP228_009091 [Amoeboaphelidium protococcarum]
MPSQQDNTQTRRCAVVGAGSVGAAISYALLLQRAVTELLLVDIDEKKVRGEVLDLSDGGYFSHANIRAGTGKEAGQCDVIIITAGAKQREGERRDQLIDRNYKILSSVLSGMKPIKQTAKIIIVANPCDVLTQFAQQIASELPRNQVFGSGTFLDTARLRVEVAQKLSVNPTAVHAYVLGEHGDSQFVSYSSATIAGVPLLDFKEFKDEQYLNELAEKTKNKAYEIINAKGATYFGIGSVCASIVQSIFGDERLVRPLSVYVDEFKCCLSVPVIIGRNGVEQILPLKLSEKEREQMKQSAQKILNTVNLQK